MTKKTILAALTGAALSAGALTAIADPIVGTSYNSTEVGVPGSTLAGGTVAPANFNISSEVVDTGTKTTGGMEIYQYQYVLPNLSSDPLTVFDVRFITALGGLVGSPNDGGTVLALEVSWSGSAAASTLANGGTFSFDSTELPVFGQADAQDNGQWQDQGVVIPLAPNVPDGGSTVALLGGSLLALQAIRRKLFC